MVLPRLDTAGVAGILGLGAHGLSPKGDVHWNLESEELIAHALRREEGRLTAHGVFIAETGERTGRSPNDRFIVDETPYTDAVWWGDVNRPIERSHYLELKKMVQNHLNSVNELFIEDLACGANPSLRLPLRVVTENAWHASFARNMFLRITTEEIKQIKPEFTILHAPNFHAPKGTPGINSDVFVIISFEDGLILIGEPTEEQLEKLKKRIETHFKDYDYATDMELAQVLFKKYQTELPEQFVPKSLKSNQSKLDSYVKEMHDESIFTKRKDIEEFIADYSAKDAKKIEKDPIFQLTLAFWDIYDNQIRPEYGRLSDEIDSLSKIYVAALREFVPGRYYPDANSTLRLAYGKVDNYEPRDAVNYEFFTTTEGIIEKYDPGSDDFDLPDNLIQLIENEDYGQYADENGHMPVCFTASNHTTGGNSGSPVINANGELIGLNFDRNWEGTMSDITYDINQCRNISVDVRYVLFIVDKFAGATHLIEEMTLVKNTAEEKKGE